MLKANKRTLIVTSLLTLFPILIGVFFWNQLPDVMATHFGMNNEANGFSSKAFAVFGLPLFCLAIHWLAALVTAQDPKKQNISPKMFSFVLWLIPLISLFTSAMLYSYNLGYPIDVSFVCELLVSVILIVVGNYLPKARQNYTIGIKLPWTLANEENWNRTHRLAGFLWMICGLIMLVLTLCRVTGLTWLVGLVVPTVLVPSLYSYWLHAVKSL